MRYGCGFQMLPERKGAEGRHEKEYEKMPEDTSVSAGSFPEQLGILRAAPNSKQKTAAESDFPLENFLFHTIENTTAIPRA